MTNEQKQTILRCRAKGMTYSRIAADTGLSLNTVKSCCQRAGLTESNDANAAQRDNNCCKQCGKKLRNIKNAKPKKYCSDVCRRAWWYANRDQMGSRMMVSVECAHCGKLFASYESSGRKYCSHSCYIAYRFGEAESA